MKINIKIYRLLHLKYWWPVRCSHVQLRWQRYQYQGACSFGLIRFSKTVCCFISDVMITMTRSARVKALCHSIELNMTDPPAKVLICPENRYIISMLPDTVLLKGGLNFVKSSRVWHIFLKANFSPEKDVNLKMFGWEKSPLEYHIFWKKHPRKNDFRGGLLSSLFSKNHSNCLKTAI